MNCAGEGRRLGLGSTKALVSVHGEPLIAWHLRMLRHVRDVVVVVGYQSEAVVEAVRKLRRDVIFAFNHDYATTGTANFGKDVLYQRYEYGALAASSVLKTKGGGSYNGPDHEAANADSDTGLRVIPLADGDAKTEMPAVKDLAMLLQILRANFDAVVVYWGPFSHQALRAGATSLWSQGGNYGNHYGLDQ